MGTHVWGWLGLLMLQNVMATIVWDFGTDVRGSSVIAEMSGKIQIWEKSVHVTISVSYHSLSTAGYELFNCAMANGLESPQSSLFLLDVIDSYVSVPTCMEVSYVRVEVFNYISTPAVTYNKHTHTILIEYALLQISYSYYDIVAKGKRSPKCSRGGGGGRRPPKNRFPLGGGGGGGIRPPYNRFPAGGGGGGGNRPPNNQFPPGGGGGGGNRPPYNKFPPGGGGGGGNRPPYNKFPPGGGGGGGNRPPYNQFPPGGGGGGGNRPPYNQFPPGGGGGGGNRPPYNQFPPGGGGGGGNRPPYNQFPPGGGGGGGNRPPYHQSPNEENHQHPSHPGDNKNPSSPGGYDHDSVEIEVESVDVDKR